MDRRSKRCIWSSNRNECAIVPVALSLEPLHWTIGFEFAGFAPNIKRPHDRAVVFGLMSMPVMHCDASGNS